MARIDVSVPETLIKKLQAFTKSELSKEEAGVLNAIFDVYRYAIENKCTVFQDHPAFIREINEMEEEVFAAAAITPTIITLTTLTTTLASHPIIGCSLAVRTCNG